MHQSKLIQLLKSLDKSEFKRFYKYLQSSFFNTNPTQVKLYQILKSTYPAFDSTKLKKVKIFRRLYPDKTFQYHHLGNLFSQMLQLLRDYLAYLEYEKDSFQKNKNLINAYGNRNLYPYFKKSTDNLIDKLSNSSYQDMHYYREMLDLKTNFYTHPLSNWNSPKIEYSLDIMELLDRYFVLNKIRMSSELKTLEKTYSSKYDIKFLDQSMNYAKQHLSKENPIFSIYLNSIFLLDKSEEEKYFFQLKKLFKKSSELMRRPEQKHIYYEMINYANRKINKGESHFNREVLDLYKICLENGILIENNKITEVTFNNIVSIAGFQKEYKWSYGFIDRYSFFLNDGIQQSVRMLSYAELEFRQGKYDKVIELLFNKEFQTVLHYSKSRLLLISSWAEKYLKEDLYYELTLSQIESFGRYIRRNKSMSKTIKKAYSNFLKTIKYIVNNKYKIISSKELKAKYSIKTKATTPMMSKAWLINKIDNL